MLSRMTVVSFYWWTILQVHNLWSLLLSGHCYGLWYLINDSNLNKLNKNRLIYSWQSIKGPTIWSTFIHQWLLGLSSLDNSQLVYKLIGYKVRNFTSLSFNVFSQLCVYKYLCQKSHWCLRKKVGGTLTLRGLNFSYEDILKLKECWKLSTDVDISLIQYKVNAHKD